MYKKIFRRKQSAGIQTGACAAVDQCESCYNYAYDENAECYTCTVELDMDEYETFLSGCLSRCPYYDPGDEYSVVRKQN